MDDLLDAVYRFSPFVDLKPGQIVWLAQSDEDKQGHDKTVELYARGYYSLDITRKNDYELKNEETYNRDMERVKPVAAIDIDKQTISWLTRLSITLVEEYLEFIRAYYPECAHLNSEVVNIDGVDN